MILVIDVGNTNITFGVYESKKLVTTFRMTSRTMRTSDEYGTEILAMLQNNQIDHRKVGGAIIASVVPKVMHALIGAVMRYLHTEPLIVGSGIKTGIKITSENPKEIGPDRIVDVVAAYEKYGGGGKLILARNCHKAVYHSIYLRRLTPVYLYPDIVPGTSLAGTLTKEQIEAALIQNPDASAVLLTSPTYDGITADIASIAETVHRFGKTLIVDAAHGAHFGFHPGFPQSPVALGADLTIVSLHKTMPCLTQTALLLQKGSRVSTERLRLFEGIYQTSSPSYLMMAAMDSCMDMVKKHGAGLWDSFFTERERFLERCSSLKRLQVLTDGTKWSRKMTSETGFLMDSGKILSETSKTCLTGKRFYDILLKQYHLQMEMAAGNYVTAIMTCCDTADGWQRLWDALKEIDDFCVAADEPVQENRKLLAYPVLKQQISLTDALDAPKAQVPLTEAAGQTAGAFINLYPPGIPIVAPGEQITQEAVDVITRYRQMNLPVQGVDHDAITILKLC